MGNFGKLGERAKRLTLAGVAVFSMNACSTQTSEKVNAALGLTFKTQGEAMGYGEKEGLTFKTQEEAIEYGKKEGLTLTQGKYHELCLLPEGIANDLAQAGESHVTPNGLLQLWKGLKGQTIKDCAMVVTIKETKNDKDDDDDRNTPTPTPTPEPPTDPGCEGECFYDIV